MGLALAQTRDDLQHRAVVLTNLYGRKFAPARQLLRAVDQLDKVRSDLDSQLARDHPERFSPHVYYMGPDQRR
jgi:hypothetical protein